MKIKRLATILSITIVMMSLVGLVQGSTVTSATVEIHPAQGDITTDIFLHVRGEPYNGTTYTTYGDFPVLYVYYDDKLIVERMEPFKVPYTSAGWTNYLLSYDVTIRVPNEFPYSELGRHRITAVIEARDGTFASAFATFDVVNYVPPPDWWEKLPQDFIDEITGAQGEKGDKGDKGDTGEIGERGETGLKGEKGETGEQGQGEQGIQGLKGDKGEQGKQGIQGEQGERGLKGEKGDKGDSASEYALIALAVSIIAILIALVAYSKKME